MDDAKEEEEGEEDTNATVTAINIVENNDNDPWANDGSILPDSNACQYYQLISSQAPTDTMNDDDDDGDGQQHQQQQQQQQQQDGSNGMLSLDIADTLLRGLEEDYKATHARTFATDSSPAVNNEVKEVNVKDEFATMDDIGEASVKIKNEEKENGESLLAEDDGGAYNETSVETNNGDDDVVSFPLHWNDNDDDAKVDIAAVRKTVQGISNDNTSKFMEKYSAWHKRQQVDDSHAVIPSAPFRAFQRDTDKAKRATASLSRSATIAEALLRCQQQNLLLLKQRDTLIVDVVGVDHVECASIGRIQETFKPIVRWLGAWGYLSPSSSAATATATTTTTINAIELRLIGRDLSKSVSAEPIDLLTTALVTPNNTNAIHKATARCFSEICYHDWRASLNESNNKNPDLIIAFNAGVWGYVEWAPTLHALGQGSIATPTVITSYTLEEAQEDFETIEEAVAGTAAKLIWGPESNPFGSKVVRDTKSSSREYRENSAWQMWLLGGDGSEKS